MQQVKDDRVVIEGLTDEEYSKFRRKVKYLYTTMKGNMNAEDISLSKLTVFGQVMMQFKNWIPRMADERVGELRYTQNLDVWEEGKYRTFLKHVSGVVNGNFSNLVSGLMAYGFMGFGAGLASSSLEEAAAKKYNDLSDEEKQNMTQDQYVEMYKANMRAAALEVQILIAAYVIFAMLKGDDDDDCMS